MRPTPQVLTAVMKSPTRAIRSWYIWADQRLQTDCRESRRGRLVQRAEGATPLLAFPGMEVPPAFHLSRHCDGGDDRLRGRS